MLINSVGVDVFASSSSSSPSIPSVLTFTPYEAATLGSHVSCYRQAVYRTLGGKYILPGPVGIGDCIAVLMYWFIGLIVKKSLHMSVRILIITRNIILIDLINRKDSLHFINTDVVPLGLSLCKSKNFYAFSVFWSWTHRSYLRLPREPVSWEGFWPLTTSREMSLDYNSAQRAMLHSIMFCKIAKWQGHNTETHNVSQL